MTAKFLTAFLASAATTFVLAWLLAGCSSQGTWTKFDAPSTEASTDYAQCEAVSNAVDNHGFIILGALAADQATAHCMAAKGYSKVQ